MSMLDEIADGRTDLVFEYLADGNAATSTDQNGYSLMQWCGYYGDVSAMKFLLAKGAPLDLVGENLGLVNACFHGHWRLCKFLIERGADVNRQETNNGETPLHAALCKTDSIRYNLVLKVLLAHGAHPNCATKESAATGGFMRDCRTRGEMPLHRAAAFGDEEAIQLLLDAGAVIDAKDMNGDSPLTWASWHLRPASILRKLCYGNFRVRPDYGHGMAANLLGKPHP
ncbi:MAG TPA: ankyrin repeat domain-containing protein [Candidatus Angelobacter sp.]|nr:ankyrin repeat domain-containing protein [Candidatus Angelobacter sp.]